MHRSGTSVLARLLAAAGAVSVPVSASLPVLYGLVLGVHVLPGVIAQELLRAPWVALITHLIAALVASAVVPLWIGRYIGTALLIGGLQELVAAISRYRHWEPWRFFLSAVIVGAVIAVAIWFGVLACAGSAAADAVASPPMTAARRVIFQTGIIQSFNVTRYATTSSICSALRMVLPTKPGATRLRPSMR